MLLICAQVCLGTNNVVSRLNQPQRLQREPILKPEHPWETLGVYFQGSVLKDPDWPTPYRMWYSSLGSKRREQQYLGYAESADGLHWHKPLRKQWGFGAWEKTNVLYGQHFNVREHNVHFYHQPRNGYRYFMTFDSRIEQHQSRDGLTWATKQRLMRHPAYTPDFDWNQFYPPTVVSQRAVYCADSCDGLTWEPADGRLAILGQADGDHVTAYDPLRKLYRLYSRDNRVDDNGWRVRQVVTASSPDTLEWSPLQRCLESDAIDDPRLHQIHGMPVTWHDGLYIGLVQMMDLVETVPGWHPLNPFDRARFHAQLAVSTDGVNFHRVADRAEFFSPLDDDPEAFDHGMIRPSGQWVFDGDRMLMYYDGRPYAHAPSKEQQARYPGISGCGPQVGIGVAQSPRDRFAGLTPRDLQRPGHVLVALPEDADQFTLNAELAPGASVTASLHHPDGSMMPGYSEEQFHHLTHSGLRLPLCWKERTGLPGPQHPCHLRLTLHGQAIVYAINPAR